MSIFIPFVDHFIHHLQERFSKHKNVLSKIQNILPKIIVNLSENEINQSIDIILAQWSKITDVHDSVVKKETLLWKMKWEATNEKPQTFIDSLCSCNVTIFPNVHSILKVCATLPVTVASVERTFSALKRIKTYLRNSSSENRLNGLASLSVHREFEIDTNEVLSRFSEKNRKISV